MSRLTSITGIARIVDPRLPTHQFHLAVAVLGGLVVMAVELEKRGSITEALGPAANAGVTVFLAWALAREVDPDEARTANLAALLVVAARLLAGPGNLAALLMFLLATRIVLRSTGLQPTLLDGLVFLPVAAFLAGRTVAGWMAALILAYALAHDHRLPDPARGYSLIAAFFVSASASAGVVLSGAFGSGWMAPAAAPLALTAAGVIAGFFLPGYIPMSRTDYTDQMLEFFRLRSTRWVLLGGYILTVVVGGGAAMAELSAVGVVLAAATLIARKLIPAFGPG